MTNESGATVRLQKFLASAGVAARRTAEELILGGHVSVNGRVVDSLPAFVDPGQDRVEVDGDRVRLAPTLAIVLHKPRAVRCGPRVRGVRHVLDLVPRMPGRVLIADRLLPETSGLVLLTTDGRLAERIQHARHGLHRVYRVETRDTVSDELCAALQKGVYTADGRLRAESVEVEHRGREGATLAITLALHGDREVRTMLAALGVRAHRLKRVSLGPLTLRGLDVGEWRELTGPEIQQLLTERAARPVSARRDPKSRRRRISAPRAAESQRGRGSAPRSRDAQRSGAPKPQQSRPVRPKPAPAPTSKEPRRKPGGGRGDDGSTPRRFIP